VFRHIVITATLLADLQILKMSSFCAAQIILGQ
jgi:hypothetical protein